jgi:cytochrome c oxidase subunit 2
MHSAPSLPAGATKPIHLLGFRELPRRHKLAALIASVILATTACSGPFPQSTLSPTADLGFQIDGLFRLILWLAGAVFVVVETLLIYVAIRYRARPGQPPPTSVHGHTLLEISWTLAPAVILIIVAVPTIQTILRTQRAPGPDALEISVIGHQWWWEYRYPGSGVVTANELHLPVGKPVVLAMTSADVIHSFWAPRLGGKRDVVQGRTNRIEFTPDSVGVFLGQCAEFCGLSHANMGLRVVVEDSAAFAAWTAAQLKVPAAPDSLTGGPARGGFEAFRKIREPASNSCIACHTIQGVSGGVLGPNLTHVGSRATIAGASLSNTPDGLARWLDDPPGVKPGSKMPKIGLTQQEIAALVAYLQSLK